MDVNESSAPPDWAIDAVFYQVFPDRFCNGDPANDPPGTEPWGNPPSRENFFGGDLKGVLEKLDYLQYLGVNALYLNPIFRGRTNHRYDTSDYLEVDPALGSNDLLRDLVAEIHRRGMKIILDGVFNHCGDGFWAFKDMEINGMASLYADWFIVRSYPVTSKPPSYHTCGNATYLPKLNTKHPSVRQYLLKVVRHWLEEGSIDGWRLDSASKVPVDFWREFRSVTRSVNPEAYLVGEVWREADPWIKGDVFDGTTNYRLRELILAYAMNELDAEDFSYEVGLMHQRHGKAACSMLNFLGNHDTARVLTTLRGEVDRVLIAMAFLMTGVGIPLIYYGDEIGMCGAEDPDCRRTMVWDETRWNHRIQAFWRELIALRHAHRALRRGTFEALAAFSGVLAYRRAEEADEVVVVLNPGPAAFDVAIPTRSMAHSWRSLLDDSQVSVRDGMIVLKTVPSVSLALLQPDPLAR